MREMTLELDNLRTAWEWGIKHGKFEAIGKAARSFGWFFEVAGLLRDGIDQLELLVQMLSDKPRDRQMDKALGTTLVQQGLLYFRTGQFVHAQELYNDSITILRTINEPAPLADALIFSGTLKHLNGDYLEAKTYIEEGLAYAQGAHDPWFTAYGIYNLGHVASLMGEYQKGYELMQEGMKIWRNVGDPHSISLGLNFLVNTQIKLDRFEEAKEAMRESIALCKQTKNRWGMGTAYRYLGLATLARGQSVEAQDYFKKSLEIFGEYFEGWDIALSLAYLGEAARMSGKADEARKTYLKALRISLDANSIPIALETLLGLSQLFVQSDEPKRAFELSYYILGHPLSTQETKDQAGKVALKTEKLLSSSQVQAIKEGILNTSLEDIVKRSSNVTTP